MNKNSEITRTHIERKQVPSFRVSDNELYMIRENNIKRIHDILKNSFTAKPNEECSVIYILQKLILDEDLETNNKNLIDSMSKTRSLFDEVYGVSETKKKLKEKLETKYK